jgi:2-polyprenyl-3-methyl-5-hydroxy-6-metoxy-1,4-benzoquinol methylase
MEGSKTTQVYWENIHSTQPRMRLPSSLIVSTGDLKKLLRAYVRPQMRVLEIGFAPGKLLSFVAKVLHAKVAGIDYAEGGTRFASQLFQALGIEGDMRCEDVFSTTFQLGTFDFVYSVGLVEHFDDPREIVRKHVELAKPGGTVLILVPNYGGLYGRLQRYFDLDNLSVHNLDIMDCSSIEKLVPRDLVKESTSSRVGRINPWLISLEKKWPRPIAKFAHLALNGLGLIQPFDVPSLCPMISLVMVRTG